MFQRTPLVAPRYGSDTALLIRRVVEVKNGCDHTVVLMREERIILMHGKWRSLLRWLDKHFIVVKLHVWTPNDLCRNPGNALIREQPTESSRVKLDIMAMQDLRPPLWRIDETLGPRERLSGKSSAGNVKNGRYCL